MPNIPKISLSRNQIIIIGIGIFLVVGVFVLLRFFGSKKPPGVPVTLTVWGMDAPDAFAGIAAGYKTVRPNVTLNYIQVPAAGYDETILKALASGKGPDIFMIGNHDLLRLKDLLAPAPNVPEVSLAAMQASFPSAVIQDLALGGTMYALPLYMDTLALLYNKQMFDQAGIATPPATWQEVIDIIPRLRVLDANGQISQAAIAMGGSEKSVTYATDILNLVMLQNGTAMSADDGTPSFSAKGGDSFRFYLQFADAATPAYTWNDVAGKSLEGFTSQKVAMAFAYQKDLAEIEKQAPFLEYAIAAAPQIDAARAVNYPRYHALGVWVGSKQKAWAWDLALFASSNSSAQKAYLAATGRPAALRSLIAAQQKDSKLSVFAKASLTARSWKMGDYDKIKAIFSTAIQNVQNGAKTELQAFRDLETQVDQLVSK